MKKPGFMKGRYGFDKLFFAVTGLCAAVAVLGYTVLWRIPHVDASGFLAVAGLIMIINTSRVFSKQISRRKAENIRFTVWLNKIRHGLKRRKRRSTPSTSAKVTDVQDKALKCACGSRLEIPSGSGRYIVVCKKCGKRNLVDA